uniref:Uncharacterized protein n=1 Tax=Knipowitschia caucasica TaxID=637954 RepID=A0AAV2L2B6_KNICA
MSARACERAQLPRQQIRTIFPKSLTRFHLLSGGEKCEDSSGEEVLWIEIWLVPCRKCPSEPVSWRSPLSFLNVPLRFPLGLS